MIEEILKEKVKAALKELGIDTGDIHFEHPADLRNGDFSTPVALSLIEQWKVSSKPLEFAKEICKKIIKPEEVDRIEPKGYGFINFYLAPQFFSGTLEKILKEDDKWGTNDTQKNETVMLEYTSPNLFKPLHIGNLVGNIIGESLARLYVFSGANVKRINYPSDIGLTVAKGVWGLQKTKGDPNDIHALGEAYRIGNEGYKTDSTVKEEIESVNRTLYAETDNVLNELRSRGVATSRARLSELCRILGTTFDKEIFESEAGLVGQKIVKEHTGGVFEESEGATVFKAGKHGLHTRVFLNSQGLPTYEAKDLGNFVLKQKTFPSWTQSIIVTGKEQTEYFKVVFAAIRDIFAEAKDKILVHTPTGFLIPTTGKMSSRTGDVITAEFLIDEVEKKIKEIMKDRNLENADEISEQVAIGAIKYSTLKQATGKDIVFDFEKALSFEGDSGPYLQYAATRAHSILEKACEQNIKEDTHNRPKNVIAIERLLYRFSEVVERAAKEHEPHYITTYLTELAAAFNSFYASERIIDAKEHKEYKVALTKAFYITMKNGLWLLGIKTPERM